MNAQTTQMRREIEEIPVAVERLLSEGQGGITAAAEAIRAADPALLVSVARGSSDHACTYLKYASELLLGLPMASVGPSVASVYGAELKLARAACISVSQSGKSPDIVEMTRSARAGGAYAVAITNDLTSPLAQTANAALGICAGPELSVAATKTFVTSLVSGLWLLAECKQDKALLDAIRLLPAELDAATRCDWSAAVDAITGSSLYTLGRGPSWAISNEAALKFKETCQIHAESYSSAEVLHGPVSIVDQDFPVIGFAAADAAEGALVDVAAQIAGKGAQVFVTSDKAHGGAQVLAHQRTSHWLTDPIALIVSFYAMVEQVAAKRGINPDAPRHLKKVTETV
ncbi:SIS domain-containing protein [Pseudoruegeria sp. SHC-113]|uniref:SIS domain-containing protein n=1 Tax=Pseudoruegeria sp. SHC-113 TaxID=2855439 RepID=UPI0021BBA095|nr:SIS domain-containing protein [Pseudoruegeria sp. SHC-113]MCT8161127.1 SIS domain-containing protein [Pseudoruegeria sp. SHC-113]